MRNDDTSLPRGAVIPPADTRDSYVGRRSVIDKRQQGAMWLSAAASASLIGSVVATGMYGLHTAYPELAIVGVFMLGMSAVIAERACALMEQVTAEHMDLREQHEVMFQAWQKVQFSPSERGRRGTESGVGYASVPLTLPGNEVQIWLSDVEQAGVMPLVNYRGKK